MYLLLGLGIGNQSVRKFFEEKGIEYLIYDDNHELYNDLEKINFSIISEVVKSAGIKNNHIVIEKAKKLNIKITNDLELFYKYKKNKKIIAISGTNGKSTTVSLLKHIIEDIDLAGNIGYPVFDYFNSNKDIIIEVSSYMGEYLEEFKPDYGGIINIFPNHLNRHLTFENYVNSKIKIFKNMNLNNVFFYNKEDITYYNINELKCLKIPFNNFYIKIHNSYLNNYQDAVKLASLIALQYGISMKTIRSRINSFIGLEHRMEMFYNHKDLIFINDSKSTNIYALNNALSFYNKQNVLLICGGLEKDVDLSLIKTTKNLKILTQGENYLKLKEEFQRRKIDCFAYQNLETLIDNLRNHLTDIDVVLFSFGFESFDQFKNFEERGSFLKKKILENFKK